MFHIILSIFVGILALLLYVISNRQITRTKTARQHNCDVPFTCPHLDPTFGSDLKLQKIQQSLRHQSITFSANLHNKYGKTFEVINFGTSSLRSMQRIYKQSILQIMMIGDMSPREYLSWGHFAVVDSSLQMERHGRKPELSYDLPSASRISRTCLHTKLLLSSFFEIFQMMVVPLLIYNLC